MRAKAAEAIAALISGGGGEKLETFGMHNNPRMCESQPVGEQV
jgi:hypothetical protein